MPTPVVTPSWLGCSSDFTQSTFFVPILVGKYDARRWANRDGAPLRIWGR